VLFRSMKNWLFPYGIWYVLASWAALTAVPAAVSGDIPDAASCGLIAAVIGVTVIRSRVRWSRSGEKALRAELARLVDERAGSGAVAWLHRDAGLLFTPDRRRVGGMRERALTVMDEDLLRDANDARLAGGGKVAATFTCYRAHPVFSRVVRQGDGMSLLVTGDDIEDASPRVHWLRRHLDAYPDMTRAMRAGLAFADASELTGVIAQFREAEPVAPGT
jgi:hypothetical protein